MRNVLDAYVRVSKVAGREGDSFISPDVQRDQIYAWAKLRGITIAEEHVDLDQSGGKIDRPGFNEAIRRAEQGITGGIVVAKIDRFARSLPGALEAIKRLEEHGAQFVSVAEGIDPTTPAGKLMQRLLLSLAEFELDRIRESWQIARQRAIGRGVHFRVPLGYQKADDGRLEPGPEADAIRTLFRLRSEGVGWAEIAERLNLDHPRDGEWLPSVLPRLVRNRAYLGEAFHGDLRHTDAHPALVTPEQFDNAQHARRTGPASVGGLLTGLLRCAGCRYPLTTSIAGRSTPVYRCQVRYGSGRCPSPATVTRHIIDSHVETEFLRHYGDIRMEGAEASQAIEDAQRRLAEAEAELDAFTADTRLRQALGHERYVSAVDQRAKEAEDARLELEDARRAGLGIIVPEGWDTLDMADRRRLLTEGIDVVWLRRTGLASIADRTLIMWRGQAPDDLPRRGAPKAPVPFDW